MDLVVVESPTKAKHIATLLGSGFRVIFTLGHLMDLPSDALGIDVAHGFLPHWELSKGKADLVKRIKDAAGKADRIYLATDPDREGEGIAYHLLTLLPKSQASKVVRVEFREITSSGVLNGLKQSRKIDVNMAMAQQTRRILDRLAGYELSPLLWQHIKGKKGLSAGRVQSAALKILYDREMDIRAFQSRTYWVFSGFFCEENCEEQFSAQLTHFCDMSLQEIPVEDERKAYCITQSLRQMKYEVEEVVRETREKQPPAPFVTSTLLQAANTVLNFSPRTTMKIAQELFEGVNIEGSFQGVITYMRTDSPRVSLEAQEAAREWIGKKYGSRSLPIRPRDYMASEQSQDAHECIRPTSVALNPLDISRNLSEEQFLLYQLIHSRFIQSQMSSAVYDEITVMIRGSNEVSSQETATFKAMSSKAIFSGWLAASGEVVESIQSALEPLMEGAVLLLNDVVSQKRQTQPPSEYTSAQFIQTLEKLGIGRPSTYSTIVDTLQSRDYIEIKKSNRLSVTTLGISVVEVLQSLFPLILDCKYTAMMESDLDEVANGKMEWELVVQRLYKEIMLAKRGERSILQGNHEFKRPKREEKTKKTSSSSSHGQNKGHVILPAPPLMRSKVSSPPILKHPTEHLPKHKGKEGFFQKLVGSLLDRLKK